MLTFELKKIFASSSGKIALALLLAMVLLASWMAVSSVEWVDEQGNAAAGLSAIRNLQNAQREWEGPLEETQLRRILAENQRISATPEAQSTDYHQNDIAYSWRQGFRPVLNMVNYAYSPDFQEWDWYRNESVTPDQAADFYLNRVRLMETWLYDETDSVYRLFSEAERQYLCAQYETLQTPFFYTYSEGWQQLLYQSTFLIMAGALILGFLTAGIFANEFKWRSDAVFFSTRHGRGKASLAKIGAGFVLVTGLYWTAIGLYMLLTLGILGISGGSCPLQIHLWKSFYNLTLWQAWVLTAIAGYIGWLFFAFLTMFVSAKTRSSLLAVTVPFLLIFLPSFLDNLGSDRLSKFLGLLPDQLLQLYQAMRYFFVYQLGSRVFSAMTLLLVGYTLLSLALVPAMYRTFRKKEIH